MHVRVLTLHALSHKFGCMRACVRVEYRVAGEHVWVLNIRYNSPPLVCLHVHDYIFIACAMSACCLTKRAVISCKRVSSSLVQMLVYMHVHVLEK